MDYPGSWISPFHDKKRNVVGWIKSRSGVSTTRPVDTRLRRFIHPTKLLSFLTQIGITSQALCAHHFQNVHGNLIQDHASNSVRLD